MCVFALIEPQPGCLSGISKAHPGFTHRTLSDSEVLPLALIDSWLLQILRREKRIWECVCLLPLSQTWSISGEEVRNLFCIADDGSFDLLSETLRKGWNAAWNNSLSFLVYSLLKSLFLLKRKMRGTRGIILFKWVVVLFCVWQAVKLYYKEGFVHRLQFDHKYNQFGTK